MWWSEQASQYSSRQKRAALFAALRPPSLWRSTAVMISVGVILNLINHGREVLTGEPLEWVKIILTFIVPFGVATFSACGGALDEMNRC